MTNLAGKDYFTVPEAAEYAGISVSHGRSRIQREFPPGNFYGKLIYRRVDVQRFIESKVNWPQSTPGKHGESLIGRGLAPRVRWPAGKASKVSGAAASQELNSAARHQSPHFQALEAAAGTDYMSTVRYRRLSRAKSRQGVE